MHSRTALFALAGVAGITLAAPAWADINAFATYSRSGAGTTDANKFSITLHNTGTTNIATFWYAWDDSDLNFLPFYPDNIQGPSGWTGYPTPSYIYTGGGYTYTYGIEWYNFSGGLAPGGTLPGFSFESNDAAAVLDSLSDVQPINPGDPPFPVNTSFVYMNYPPEGPGDAGFQFVVAPAAAPEPASLGILGLGILALCRRARRTIASL